MAGRTSGMNLTLTWVAIMVLLVAAGAGAWLWQRRQNDDEVARLNERIEQLQAQTTQQDSAQPTESLSQAQTVDNRQPPVVFDPPSEFGTEVQQELNDKVLRPHHMYQQDQGRTLAAYYVATGTDEDTYVVTAIFEQGNNAYESFQVDGDDGLIWTPVCRDACEFSDEFEQSYPDIVERAQ